MSDLPKISIVTPSFNQANFLERTIRSVLDQGYPNLEYIVIDGGSTDGSVEVIRKYEHQLTYWVSEPDDGQTAAINKGLRRATGEWVAWQNSDDVYYPGTFEDLAQSAAKHPEAHLIIGNMMIIDAYDRELRDVRYVTPSHGALLAEGMVVVNQAAFWRRHVHRELGWLDESFDCSFDYEWFLRLTKRYRSAHVNRLWGAFRLHDAAKTSNSMHRFMEENKRILHGRTVPYWMASLYRLRRMALMLGQGNISYLVRGIIRRAQGKGGELY